MQHKFLFNVELMVNGKFNAYLSMSSTEDSGVIKYYVFFILDSPKPINCHRVFLRKSSAYKYFNGYLSKLNKSLI